jgi:superfamily I DNA/RNA helicase
MTTIDYKKERNNEIDAIKNSSHPRKIIVGGPGTGKSYLFAELIKKKRAEGKTQFLAITFIGKLGDALADDLCGLAETVTMHSFARKFVLEQYRDWSYYPRIRRIIEEDLRAEGIDKYKIGDENYAGKSKHYKVVGDDDVVYYAVQICREDESKIPTFDLILIDEYQDFNEIESELVDLLAKKNEIIIVGDDDQALYGFKGSSPGFIRKKFHDSNTEWESKNLRFCSRCTEIIIKYFHALIEKYNLNSEADPDPTKRRIKKEFICYMPEGERDSKIYDSRVNHKIHLIKSCPPDMAAYKIRKALESIIENQNIKEVLIIGEGQSCRASLKKISQQLKNYGFKYVDFRDSDKVLPLRQNIIDAYKSLAKDEASLLGWRILKNPTEETDKQRHLKNVKTLDSLINGTPSEIEQINKEDIFLLEDTVEGWNINELNGDLRQIQNEIVRKKVLVDELKQSNLYLRRPLCNLGVTVCNILNSKGLSADVVFLIGFDKGRFPSKNEPTESEIYQMLVAVTRAKKRIYLINTIGKDVSSFIDCLASDDLAVETINI